MNKFFIPLLILLYSCSHVSKWQEEFPDNYAEEVFEDLIKEKTGKNIDLTPLTGEERQSYINQGTE